MDSSEQPHVDYENPISLLDHPDLSCTLDSSQVPTRKDLLQQVISKLDSTPIHRDGTYLLQFNYNLQLAHQLLDFILQEQLCCDFLDFDLQFKKNKDQLTLVISSESLDHESLDQLVHSIIG